MIAFPHLPGYTTEEWAGSRVKVGLRRYPVANGIGNRDMSRLQLSEEELGATVQRAREIAEQTHTLTAPAGDVEAFLSAAEEMGIPREASLQALRERGLVADQSYAVGEKVFAPSADGNWYPATLSMLDGVRATVRFVSGGEASCATSDLRPFQLLPGTKLEGDIKDWGWWPVAIERYDEVKGKVHVTHDDWMGGKEALPLHKLRLSGKKTKIAEKQAPTFSERYRAALVRCALLAGGGGVALGFAISQLLQWLGR